MFAVYSNHQEIVKLLLQQAADVNAQNKSRETALHFALYRGNQDIIKLLIDHNADTTILDNDGNSPLSRMIERKLH